MFNDACLPATRQWINRMVGHLAEHSELLRWISMVFMFFFSNARYERIKQACFFWLVSGRIDILHPGFSLAWNHGEFGSFFVVGMKLVPYIIWSYMILYNAGIISKITDASNQLLWWNNQRPGRMHHSYIHISGQHIFHLSVGSIPDTPKLRHFGISPSRHIHRNSWRSSLEGQPGWLFLSGRT